MKMIRTATVSCVKFARKPSGTETNYKTTQHIIKWNFTSVWYVQVFRTVRAFESHQKTHSVRHTCTVCKTTFELKSTLKNHMAVHSTDLYKCPHKGCTKELKHRGNFLEHVNWSHRNTKDVPLLTAKNISKHCQVCMPIESINMDMSQNSFQVTLLHLHNKWKATSDPNSTQSKKPRK